MTEWTWTQWKMAIAAALWASVAVNFIEVGWIKSGVAASVYALLHVIDYTRLPPWWEK